MGEENSEYEYLMLDALKHLEDLGITFDKKTKQIIFFIAIFMYQETYDEDEEEYFDDNYVYVLGEEGVISLAKSYVLKEKLGCVYPIETEVLIEKINDEIKAREDAMSTVDDFINENF